MQQSSRLMVFLIFCAVLIGTSIIITRSGIYNAVSDMTLATWISVGWDALTEPFQDM